VSEQGRRITYSKKAQKYISKQDRKNKLALKAAIENLPSGDIKYFKSNNTYRLRVSDFRVLYYFVSDNGDIHIDKIGSRGDVYK